MFVRLATMGYAEPWIGQHWGAFEGDIMNGVAVAMMSLFLCMALNNWRDKVHYKDKRERYEAETGRKAP